MVAGKQWAPLWLETISVLQLSGPHVGLHMVGAHCLRVLYADGQFKPVMLRVTPPCGEKLLLVPPLLILLILGEYVKLMLATWGSTPAAPQLACINWNVYTPVHADHTELPHKAMQACKNKASEGLLPDSSTTHVQSVCRHVALMVDSTSHEQDEKRQ